MSQKNIAGYMCSLCKKVFDAGDELYTCPEDGGNLDVLLDYDEINSCCSPQTIMDSRESSLWRYLPLLPVSDPGGQDTPIHQAGFTPTYALDGLKKELGINNFWLKDESRNPTASFKDRASAVVVARALEIKADVVVTASTGNAGAALAGMSAAVGQKAVIFAPKTAPQAKIAQLLVFGARVILVDGNYDQAFDLTIEAAKEFGWYCRNTGFNPFTAEGKKTAAFEIWEQVIKPNKLNKPLSVFIPVGDGNIISGIHKGFKDLAALGWLDIFPRLFGVQTVGSAAIANAFFAGNETIIPVEASTIADSISVDLPRDGVRAVRAVTQTDGAYITVEDNDSLKAIAELGRFGVFAEPAGATAFAGFKKALKTGLVHGDDPILVLNTGSGLKDVRAAMQAVHEAPVIKPTLDALKTFLKG
ncbi:MAG: threonine synthase [Anaerolineae bacterium]|nr:threonine synthase [Anaerolineae bacterium]